MLALRIVTLLLLMAVCCVTPGFLVVRRLRWGAAEKVCGSIAAENDRHNPREALAPGFLAA